MKNILVLIAAALFSATPALAAGKIVYVDTQTVYEKTKLGAKYQGILREYFESRKKILDIDRQEIQKLQEEFAKQSAVLKPEARKEKEETINRKISEFEKKANEFNNEVSKKNEELSMEFNQDMLAVLKDVAKKEKASLILNKSINILSRGEVPAVLYADEDLDLTNKVIAEMDRKFEAAK
jgi:outer membrane protein